MKVKREYMILSRSNILEGLKRKRGEVEEYNAKGLENVAFKKV